MSTGQTLQIESTSLQATLDVAASIGRNLRGGEVFELVSDLGGGKTAFAKGLAVGLGITDTVKSPSFTISSEYQGANLRFYHFDFYRLDDAGIMRNELDEALQDAEAVAAVEWAQIISDVLPEDHITINILATDETTRQISVKYPAQLAYVLEGLV